MTHLELLETFRNKITVISLKLGLAGALKQAGCIILSVCLICIPLQAQAANHDTSAKPNGAAKIGKAGKSFRDCAGCPEMVVIPRGSLKLGSPNDEEGRNDNEDPGPQVNFASFALGKYEITRAQFAAFVKQTKYIPGEQCKVLVEGKFEESSTGWRTPGFPQSDNHPAVCISWDDAKAYAIWLSKRSDKKYRLPTEAEWEYAARARSISARYWGDNPDESCAYANTADKTAQVKIQGTISWVVHHCADGYAYTSPVGKFKANGFGLFDMLGNVLEWTEDVYEENYPNVTPESKTQEETVRRVLRGGSWYDAPRFVRSAARDKAEPKSRYANFGFRLARSLP